MVLNKNTKEALEASEIWFWIRILKIQTCHITRKAHYQEGLHMLRLTDS